MILRTLCFLSLLFAGAAAHAESSEYELRIEKGSKVSQVSLKTSTSPKLKVEIRGERPKQYALVKSDVEALLEPIEILKSEAPHEFRFCNRRQLTLYSKAQTERIFCLDSKSKAGDAAQALLRRVEIIMRVKTKLIKATK